MNYINLTTSGETGVLGSGENTLGPTSPATSNGLQSIPVQNDNGITSHTSGLIGSGGSGGSNSETVSGDFSTDIIGGSDGLLLNGTEYGSSAINGTEYIAGLSGPGISLNGTDNLGLDGPGINLNGTGYTGLDSPGLNGTDFTDHGLIDGNYTYNDTAYDYGNMNPKSYIANSLELPRDYILDYAEYRNVLETCNKTIQETPLPRDGVYCNATWDRMQCWGYVKAGETSYQPCPGYITLSNPLAYSKKTCNSDGTWFEHPETERVWTNYTMCYDHSVVENHKRVLYMYYYGFSISIVLLVISLIIFSMFRQLKCVRVTLHKHLFSSYVITGALWIMYYSMVPMNSEVLLKNPIWCQVLHVLTHYFTVCNYAWMFCEGFYLHALIVITFTKDKKLLFMCYIIGWLVPIIPTLIYTIIRALDEEDNNRCWTGDSVLHWILAGPINASLIVNFIFSVNIMRILLSKLRSVHNNETMQTRRAVRATLILIPLLGLQYIAFPFKPPPGASGEYVYSMISAFLVSFQGVFVSLVFCFFNGEVIKCFKKWWHRRNANRSTSRRFSTKTNGEKESMLRSMCSRDGDTKITTQTTSIGMNNNSSSV